MSYLITAPLRAVAAAALFFALTTDVSAKGFVALVSRDPEPLLKWYAEALDTQLVRSVKPDGRDFMVYVLDGPNLTVEIQYKLDAIQHPERANRRQGIMKAGFSVAALEPWLTRWADMKATIIAGRFDDQVPPMRSVVLLDPDGNSIYVLAPL
jgi:Glyoxalase/Bleomycin resistance protein/Dioxygenase superfamily